MFKLGDKIKVIDDDQKGRIIRIQKNQITILNEFDFEETYWAHELLPDIGLEVGRVQQDKADFSVEKKSSNSQDFPKEIDLHIGQLVDSYTHLTNFEMLQIQLQKIEDEMDLAKLEKRNRLIFIHGHGTGKLKTEMMKFLQKYAGIEIYDASFRKYKLGATEVKFR